FVAVRMTIDAERALLSSDHLIVWLDDRVIAMTSDAFSELLIVESFLVRARLKQFSLAAVALAANVCDRSNARRRRAMIAVTIVARRRGEILFVVQRLGVHAGLIFIELIAGNAERLHVVRARVALRAGRRDVRWVDGRERIAGRANAVNAVTTDASRHARFALLLQQTAVHTGVVLTFLIDAQ